MGKAARNRAIQAIAVQATVGRPREETKSVARLLRRRAGQQRRAFPTRRHAQLAHQARSSTE